MNELVDAKIIDMISKKDCDKLLASKVVQIGSKGLEFELPGTSPPMPRRPVVPPSPRALRLKKILKDEDYGELVKILNEEISIHREVSKCAEEVIKRSRDKINEAEVTNEEKKEVVPVHNIVTDALDEMGIAAEDLVNLYSAQASQAAQAAGRLNITQSSSGDQEQGKDVSKVPFGYRYGQESPMERYCLRYEFAEFQGYIDDVIAEMSAAADQSATINSKRERVIIYLENSYYWSMKKKVGYPEDKYYGDRSIVLWDGGARPSTFMPHTNYWSLPEDEHERKTPLDVLGRYAINMINEAFDHAISKNNVHVANWIFTLYCQTEYGKYYPRISRSMKMTTATMAFLLELEPSYYIDALWTIFNESFINSDVRYWRLSRDSDSRHSLYERIKTAKWIQDKVKALGGNNVALYQNVMEVLTSKYYGFTNFLIVNQAIDLPWKDNYIFTRAIEIDNLKLAEWAVYNTKITLTDFTPIFTDVCIHRKYSATTAQFIYDTAKKLGHPIDIDSIGQSLFNTVWGARNMETSKMLVRLGVKPPMVKASRIVKTTVPVPNQQASGDNGGNGRVRPKRKRKITTEHMMVPHPLTSYYNEVNRE